MRFSFLLLLLCWILSAADESALNSALEKHRWFELRDLVLGSHSSALYQFYVAAAFNDANSAEKELRKVESTSEQKDRLANMYFTLNRLYYRIGNYRKAADAMERCLALANQDPAPQDKASIFSFRQLPSLKVVARRPSVIKYSHPLDWQQVAIPIDVNGKPARYIVDSDAVMCVVSQQEAKRLGLRMTRGGDLFEGITGKSEMKEFAVADRLKIGNSEVRNVAFIVFPDDTEVFAKLPAGQRGAIGLSVLIALETVGWNSAGEFRIGFPGGPADLRNANLSFDDTSPLTLVEIQGHKLAVDLDTGTDISSIWPRFGLEFPELVEGAPETKFSVRGATGSADLKSVTLPELRIKAGGFPIFFRNAPVLLDPTIALSRWHYGQLGVDQFSQASELKLDFRALHFVLK
ncbi:MAG TPA: retropepsin-like aspartic protease [Bryobacteraceae bacterium]|nr:retropepsin-like aspartic protease [Bryobacteraceae bacterium]